MMTTLQDFAINAIDYVWWTNSISFHLSFSVAKQLAYLYPRFYNCSVPDAFSADLPQLSQLCEGTKAPLTSEKSAAPLLSARGEKFVSFAKSEQFVEGKQFHQLWLCCITTLGRWTRTATFLLLFILFIFFFYQFSIFRGLKAEEWGVVLCVVMETVASDNQQLKTLLAYIVYCLI